MKPYWNEVSFADVKKGDHVRLFNAEQVAWSTTTIIVDDVKEGALKYRGAWYYECDEWSVGLVDPARCSVY